MADGEDIERTGGESRNGARRSSGSSSYLVRVWRETGSDARARFYVRDLRTGEERYLGDPKRIGEVLTAGLQADKAKTAGRREGAGSSGRSAAVVKKSAPGG